MNIGEIILSAIEWAVVPLVLAGILIYGLFGIPEESAPSRVRTAAQAGKWAGLIIFVIYVISLRSRTLTFSFRAPNYDFMFWPTALAALAGLMVSGVFDFLRSTRFIGFLVLTIVSATAISLYSYLFIRTVRNDLVFMLLGLVLGILLYEIIFPEGLPDSWARALSGFRASAERERIHSEPAIREDRKAHAHE